MSDAIQTAAPWNVSDKLSSDGYYMIVDDAPHDPDALFILETEAIKATVAVNERPALLARAAELEMALRLDADGWELAADRMDLWAKQSRSGGWSTHQVEANETFANDCRRRPAKIRAALTKTAALTSKLTPQKGGGA